MSPIFQAGGALPAEHLIYVERQADLEALRAALNGDYLHVIAPRQIGKTSLLKRLAFRLDEMGWHCAYIDLSTLMDFPKPVWYAELGKEIAHTLTPDRIPALTNQIDLRRYLLNEVLSLPDKQPCIALFFDEVEGAGKARSADGLSFSDTFFMTLRSLYIQRDDYDGTLVIALSGAVNPSNLVKDPDISPFNVGQEIDLDSFNLAEMQALTNHLADLDLPVDEAVHQVISDWTCGHPYLAQRTCTELEKAASELTAITPANVNSIVNEVILNPANPLRRDKNLRHVTKMVTDLSEPASQLWSRLRDGDEIPLVQVNDDLYLELYLTGAVKLRAENLVISNRIYERAFMRSSRTMQTNLNPPDDMSPTFNLRLQHLADNIRQDLDLLKEYEDALRYEDDPRRRTKYRREIEDLRASAARYQQEYAELSTQSTHETSPVLGEISVQLQQMDAKLSDLLAGQTIIRDDINDLRQALLVRFDASEQAIVAAVVEQMDQNQLATVQAVIEAIEAETFTESQSQETLSALQQVLSEIQQHNVTIKDASTTHQIEQAAEIISAPHLDLKHKLLITAPIIPFILSYEGEVELGSGVNLESVWQRLVAKVRGSQG